MKLSPAQASRSVWPITDAMASAAASRKWGIYSSAGDVVPAFQLEWGSEMTPLRMRMIEDMTLAGFAPRTRDVYIQAVRGCGSLHALP